MTASTPTCAGLIHPRARAAARRAVLPFAHGPHTFPRMRFLLACLASLALVGCNGSRTEDPAVDEEALFGPAAMRIHPIFTDVKDWTGDDKADGVEVLVEFQDQFGDPTKAAGTLIFELYDYRIANPEPRGRRLVNPWIGSVVTLDEQRARWNRTSRTYTFQLAYPTIDAGKSYVLTATFNSSTGARFFDRAVLEGEEVTLEPTSATTRPATRPVAP